MKSSKMIIEILVQKADRFKAQCSKVKSFFKEHSNSLAPVFSQDFVVNIIIRLLMKTHDRNKNASLEMVGPNCAPIGLNENIPWGQ